MAKRKTRPCHNCGRPVAVRHEREGLIHIIWDIFGDEHTKYGCKDRKDRVAE